MNKTNWQVVLCSIIALCLCIAAGCSMLYDLYPCAVPRDTATYTDQDPDRLGWQSIGKLKELAEASTTKNITVQLDLADRMALDKALYDRAISQANINIQSAQAERQQLIGTVQNPGWLMTLLLGGGFASAGGLLTKLTHYTQAEYDAAVAAARAASTPPASPPSAAAAGTTNA